LAYTIHHTTACHSCFNLANTEGGSCDSSRTDDGSQSQDGERPLLRPSAFNTTAGQGQ